MRVLRFVTLVAVCLGLTGCSLFGKHARNSQTGAGGSAAPNAGSGQTAGIFPPLPPDRSPPPGAAGGVLAGRVIDGYNRAPPPTYIQVTLLDAAGRPSAAPVDVAVNAQGYFVIPGLQAGQHYQLTARARDGTHVLAGSVYETPPNPKVLIRMSEDFASSTTPPVPPAPAWGLTPRPQPGPAAPPPVWPEDAKTPAGPGWTPGQGSTAPQGPRQAVELGPPIKTQEGGGSVPPGPQSATLPPVPPPSVTMHPENIVGNGPVAKGQVPCDIPGSRPLSLGSPAPAPALPAPVPSAVPRQIPFCQLTGQQLDNFALYDLNGQPFEFRRSTRGRLVLLDFWGTWCMPCQHAIPHLKGLQQMYGPYGLEVIGIDYEESCPTVPEQMMRARRVCARLGVNYRVLLGTDDPQQAARCPVRQQFGVASWPTLVLLDENSRVIWRSEGLDGPKVRELEMLIRQRLGIR